MVTTLTPVSFDVPPGACDCHTHIFGDSRRFPFTAGRTYTLEPASLDALRALHRALHTSRVVIVQPVLWATNWPHPDARPVAGRAATDIAPLRRIDDGGVCNLFPLWEQDPAQRRTILVDNPARLYGF